MILWSSPTCPYAHRSRALFHRLEVPHTLEQTPLLFKRRAFRAVSPTGKVPLLLHEENTIPESIDIADYIVQHAGWEAGFPGPPDAVACQRHAMAQFDQTLLPRAYYSAIRWYPLGGRRRAAIDPALDALEAAIATAPPDSVLGIHVATFWRRFRVLDFMLPVVRWIEARPTTRAWLDEAAHLPAVVATAPNEARIRLEYRAQQVLTWGFAAAGVAWLVAG